MIFRLRRNRVRRSLRRARRCCDLAVLRMDSHVIQITFSREWDHRVVGSGTRRPSKRRQVPGMQNTLDAFEIIPAVGKLTRNGLESRTNERCHERKQEETTLKRTQRQRVVCATPIFPSSASVSNPPGYGPGRALISDSTVSMHLVAIQQQHARYNWRHCNDRQHAIRYVSGDLEHGHVDCDADRDADSDSDSEYSYCHEHGDPDCDIAVYTIRLCNSD